MSATELATILALAVSVAMGVVALMRLRRMLRTRRLRTRFGGSEYALAVEEAGSREHAEDGLDARTERVAGFHIRPLASDDRARFAESWRRVEAAFADSPAGAVTEADQLLSDIMARRGYPVSTFDRRGADISVDHPSAVGHHRAVQVIELGLTRGKTGAEELRRAMLHYRTVLEELLGEPEAAHVTRAS